MTNKIYQITVMHWCIPPYNKNCLGSLEINVAQNTMLELPVRDAYTNKAITCATLVLSQYYIQGLWFLVPKRFGIFVIFGCDKFWTRYGRVGVFSYKILYIPTNIKTSGRFLTVKTAANKFLWGDNQGWLHQDTLIILYYMSHKK